MIFKIDYDTRRSITNRVYAETTNIESICIGFVADSVYHPVDHNTMNIFAERETL